MNLIDTHVHIYSEEYDDDRTQVMERAANAGVYKFVIPAIDSEVTSKMYALEQEYPQKVHLMMGLHPTYVKPESYLEELAHVERELASRKFVAVGEIGIDLFWDQSTLAIQQEAFRRQIQLAKRYKLPINIHCRNAFDEVFEVLEEERSPELFGIFHCFTGNMEQAQQAISLNMKLGIGGVATFKNGKIDQFLNEIPLQNIVLETDGPYLAPLPYRGKRNESSYLREIVAKLAVIYNVTEEEIATVTTKNACDVYSI